MPNEISTSGQPLITVIIAVYNGAATLQQCIDSVLRQTYQNIELIVIDGGSTDTTLNVLTPYLDRLDYWISEPDKGVYDAWNKGLAQTHGDWVCFLGADDYFWDDMVLAKMAVRLISLPDVIRLAYGQIMVVDEQSTVMHASGQPWSVIGHRFRSLMCIPHPATMHRASLFAKHGRFDDTFRIAGDYDLLLRELKDGQACFMEGLVTAGVRLGGVSTDPANILLAMRELRRAQKRQGIVFPTLLWSWTIVKVYLRLALTKMLGERVTKAVLRVVRRCPGLSLNWTETK
jgi:glycosyltransferase involved in cell wall biosynthesis